jgi:hypothetical protein
MLYFMLQLGRKEMVSTVTTSTVTTISTATALGVAATVGLAGALTLIGLLMTRELAGAQSSSRCRLVAAFCNIGILPLALAFGVTVAVKVIEVLS